MSGNSNKTSIIIGVLSASLVLAVGAAAFWYVQSKNITPPEHTASQIVAPTAVAAPIATPSLESAVLALYNQAYNGRPIALEEGKQTRFWFEQNFTINNESYHAKFFATESVDENGDAAGSRAEAGEIGAITYKLANNQWVAISKQPKFAEYGSNGVANEATPQLVSLPPNSMGLLLDYSYGMGGNFEEGKSVFVFNKGMWVDAGPVQTGYNNSGTCDTPEDNMGLGPCFNVEGTISVAPSSTNPDFPDLVVAETGTEKDENTGKIIPVKRNSVWSLKEGKYNLK